MTDDGERRPISARSNRWVQLLATSLGRSQISPNQISVASVIFSAIGAALLLEQRNALGLIGCAIAIQLRLMCNLLDGMVAIEGGKHSPTGQLYNEFPDRIADSMLIVALGYAIEIPSLGWLGALAAALTAYVRVFGGALGLPQDFRGPMAKQHRMAVMTIGCLVGAFEFSSVGTQYALLCTSGLIAIGSIVTCMARTRALARCMRQAGS